ncbi:hypothetical protein [Streptomyces sp. NPDC006691]|uniref:hypothetical protein n=1 Tax=Streptomyces sp. NPDC006691 TaxID=3364757 RepID=UPI00367B90DF
MWHYCGCRDIPLIIKEFIAEHERVADAADDAQRALAAGDTERARELVAFMAAELETPLAGRGVEPLDGRLARGPSGCVTEVAQNVDQAEPRSRATGFGRRMCWGIALGRL